MKQLLVGVICLILGYFAGREHLKHEIKGSFQEAANEISRSFAGSDENLEKDVKLEPKSSPKPKSKKKEERKLVLVELTKKGFIPSNSSAGRFDSYITFTVNFDNRAGKGIRAFDGLLTFYDLLDNELLSAKVAINDPVANYMVYEWSGTLDYNQFKDSHQRLKGAEFNNLKINFEPRKILYDDGSVQEYN